MSSRLRKFVERSATLGLTPCEDAADRLERFTVMILNKGVRLALVSKADLGPRSLADKHFADARSALLFAGPPPGARVLDFGAGAGVVGVTWSLLRPDLRVTLLESRHKKAHFLRTVVEGLPVENAVVLEGRGEDAAPPHSFDLVVSRGMATDRKILRAYHDLLAPEGSVFLFKGPESGSAAIELLASDGRFAAPETIEISLPHEKVRVFVKAVRAEPEE
ncbi:MAG: RsmG family class I SAM-dependent methyltransferase [Candidatus Eisenbacteria bacterium]